MKSVKRWILSNAPQNPSFYTPALFFSFWNFSKKGKKLWRKAKTTSNFSQFWKILAPTNFSVLHYTLFCTTLWVLICQNPMKGDVGFSWKIVEFPSLDPFFFVAKNVFFEFSEKMSNFFSMKLTVKNFQNFFQWIQQWKIFEIFFNEFSSKKFLIVNFRLWKKFESFYCWIHWTKFRKVFTVDFIEKKFESFSKNWGF